MIFLDAVGTLFGVRGSVGQIYSAIAHQFGIETAADEVDRAFLTVFKMAPPPVFPSVTSEDRKRQEFYWWRDIVHKTFAKVGAVTQFQDFEGFFNTLYDYFATVDPWVVYPDVVPSLQRWQEQGIELGVISNFDSRLYAVLDALELRSWFSSITISSTVGAAKPDPKIFSTALAKHHVPAEKAWHIGDSLKEDYRGAKAVGLRAFLLKR